MKATTLGLGLMLVGTAAKAQGSENKPLLLLKVDAEKVTLTSAKGVQEVSQAELHAIEGQLRSILAETFEVIPLTDKRDCIEVAVVVEKLSLRQQVLFVGSSAVAVGKGDEDLLITHNPIVQPSTRKVADAVAFQLSVMRLQSLTRDLEQKK